MTVSDFFEKLQDQFTNNLPLVAYRNPNETTIKAFLQHTDTVFETTDFSESGFVFAPFNLELGSILIPDTEAIKIQCTSSVSEEHVSNTRVSDASQIIDEISAKKNHTSLVEKGLQAIAENKFKKVVLSRQESVLLEEVDSLKTFNKLLIAYPTAYVYMWFHPKVGLWLGATPETLLHLENKQFTTMSLAGTQVYKSTSNVIWGEKELEEQQIVTNFIVSNLENYSENLKASKVETTKAGNLLHLKTHISGRIKSGASNLKVILSALHPTPAVCGMPKETAQAFINHNETYKREFYTGFLGELNLKKTLSRNTNRRNVENNAYTHIKTVSNLFVNLRCMQFKNSQALIYIGGGITKGSNPNKEWEETVAKSSTMKKVLQ